IRLQRLLGDKKITLEITPEARALVAREGYEPAFGARPIKRAIQRLIQDPLAMAVLDGRVNDGDHVVVDVGADGRMEFHTAAEPVVAGA
ncbi:MAG TPA: hypothetical protein VHQ45_00050, partial [Gemmatimonadaceae bacterium]|nr:hypothetical protein [Gemmatimonadaceae bacterium]